MAGRLYWVVCEARGVLNPGERGFRSLDKARALCAREREECSWDCMTPPGDDNSEGGPTSGRFRCGVLSPHGIAVQISEGSRNIEPSVQDPDLDPDQESFRRAKGAGPRIDWALNVVIDRGTDALADGDDTLYYIGPQQTEDAWDGIVQDIASGDEVVDATVTALDHGRYHHLTEDREYPLRWKGGRFE